MDEKMEEIIKQYPIRVENKRRIRGAILLETREGLYTLANYKESMKKLAFQEKVKEHLIKQGYEKVDKVICNQNGEYITKDKAENGWIVKRWFQGRECNLRERSDIDAATLHLAKLHNMLCHIEVETEENTVGEKECENLKETLERHMREMRRVYNYIRSKHRKNDMEICILNSFAEYYQQADMARSCLETTEYEKVHQKSVQEGKAAHGTYNYHNILFQEKGIATMNFDKVELGIQIVDMYGFLRKIQEKNNWNVRRGIEILERYQKNHPLEEQEAKILYVMLQFPEKYWKQINFYHNGKKAWMSVKNYEKLLRINEQEEARRKFLNEVKTLLF